MEEEGSSVTQNGERKATLPSATHQERGKTAAQSYRDRQHHLNKAGSLLRAGVVFPLLL